MKRLIILTVLLLSACGMQGDLYLPEEKPAQAELTHENSN